MDRVMDRAVLSVTFGVSTEWRVNITVQASTTQHGLAVSSALVAAELTTSDRRDAWEVFQREAVAVATVPVCILLGLRLVARGHGQPPISPGAFLWGPEPALPMCSAGQRCQGADDGQEPLCKHPSSLLP